MVFFLFLFVIVFWFFSGTNLISAFVLQIFFKCLLLLAVGFLACKTVLVLKNLFNLEIK